MSSVTASYGAFELKSTYQKNMITAFLLGAIINLGVIGGFLLATQKSDVAVTTRTIVVKSITDLAPPPQLQKLPPQSAYQVPEVALPTVGIPEAVPDEEAPENANMATQDQLKVLSAPPVESADDAPVDDIVIENIDELLPRPDDFVPVEQQPQIVKSVTPEYPEMARRMSLVGKVWIKALVDKTGKVRDVIVVKPSGVDAGFEESAVKAAYQYIYTPAIANGQPIAIWVMYPVSFSLND